ncbi:hypothetical protein RRG08_040933 [Elysia crispata]|uniref:Uncharacterized protein n=1 Tax=Elysia crispata TaxID=231223 RepID=A0AAE1CKD1_9GAST|nr:hypothetical protein RRG08_040933 [Elysia crispata]
MCGIVGEKRTSCAQFELLQLPEVTWTQNENTSSGFPAIQMMQQSPDWSSAQLMPPLSQLIRRCDRLIGNPGTTRSEFGNLDLASTSSPGLSLGTSI